MNNAVDSDLLGEFFASRKESAFRALVERHMEHVQAVAWLVTLPAAALVGALSYWLSDAVKSLTSSQLAGDGLIFLILVGLSYYLWWRASKQKVDSSNVNADWDTSTNSVVPAEVREAAKTDTRIKTTTSV